MTTKLRRPLNHSSLNHSLNHSWIAVEFEVGAADEDLACWLMMRQGAQGCEVKPLNGDSVLLHCVFERDTLPDMGLTKWKASLEEYGLTTCLNSLRLKTIIEDDWLSKWKEGLEPFAVGERFLICPPWLADSLGKQDLINRHLILLEPGMAFGTGLHATTRFCLRAMERHLSGAQVLDVGTGSGILAIAAALLDNQCKITAVDTAASSMKVAGENLTLNNVSARVELIHGSTECVTGRQFNTLLSNLTCEDIMALLPDYERLAESGASVICAGILKEKLPALEQHLAGSSFTVVVKEEEDVWAGLVLRKA